MVDTTAACSFGCDFFDGFDKDTHKLFCTWEGSTAEDRRAAMEKWRNEAATDIMDQVILHLADKYVLDSRSRFIGWGGHIYVSQGNSDATVAIKIGCVGFHDVSGLKGKKKARLCIDGLWFYLKWIDAEKKWNIDFSKLDEKLEQRLKEAKERSERVDKWQKEIAVLKERLEEAFKGVGESVQVVRLEGVDHITIYAPWGSISCESDQPFLIRSIRFERNVKVEMDTEQI